MKQKTEVDVIELFSVFQKDVLTKKPTQQEMYADVRMMQFKVRPVMGDISSLNFQNGSFIEALWSLGKLDEFFHDKAPLLSKTEKKTFYKLFDGLYKQYQDELNLINLKSDQYNLKQIEDEEKEASGFEVEIFREKDRRDN